LSLLYSIYINKNINITTGFTFNQFGEKANYNTVNYFAIDTTLYLTSDSASILSWDSINHVVYVTYNSYSLDTILMDSNNLIGLYKNRHSYFTLPLMMGYEFQLKKWNFNLRIGMGVSFLIKNKANYLNYELSNFISPPSKKIVLNYLISPSISYQINTKFGIEINPKIIINNSSLIRYKEVKQTYINFGINFGINYSL